jgi:hypothetical protein
MNKAAEPKIYFYKLTADTGGAPCVEGGLLSLAICKPMIRKGAKCGDLIIGFAADKLHRDNALIYVARVTDKLCDGRYYKAARYARRGDCIYRAKGDRYEWKARARHHGPEHIKHDLGSPLKGYPRANVLLSTEFRYFGDKATNNFRFPELQQALRELGRGHRVRHTEELRKQLRHMADRIFQRIHKKKIGEPMQKPSPRDCHRAKSCGVC